MSVPEGLNPGQPRADGNNKEYPKQTQWPVWLFKRIILLIHRACQGIIWLIRKMGLHHAHAPHWVIALFTLLLVIFAYQAWNESTRGTAEMKRQADYMQGQLNELKSDRRPWVAIEAFIGGITWDSTGAHVLFKFQLKNTGHSPAMNVVLEAELAPHVSADPKEMPRGVLNKILLRQVAPNNSYGFPVFPGATTEITNTLEFNRDWITKIEKLLSTGRRLAPDTPVKGALDHIPMEVVYVVGYTSDIRTDRHQTYCIASVDQSLPGNPLLAGVSPLIDKNLRGDEMRLDLMPIDCGAN